MNDCSPALEKEAGLSPQPAPASHHVRRPPIKMILVIAALIGAMLAVSLLPIRAWIQDVGKLREALAALGAWKFPICALAVGVLVGCGVPRLVFCAVGGMILGFWGGMGVVSVGTVLGYYSVFLFVRWGGRDWVMHRWPGLKRWSEAMRGQGFMAVLLARQLPLHGTFVNLVLGLSRVRHRHFLFGTIIGMMPEAIPLTLVGAGLMKASIAGRGRYIGMAAVALAGLWIAAGFAVSKMRKNRLIAIDGAASRQP